jgi:hypothetical protein
LFQDVRALDKYWDTLYLLFWSRLQRIIDLNVQSVKDCDPQRMKVLDLRPHYVSLFSEAVLLNFRLDKI